MFVLVMVLMAAGAQATPQNYCALYAKDFADGLANDGPVWQRKHDGALADCLAQYVAEPVVVAPAAEDPPKAKAKAKADVAEPEAKPDKATAAKAKPAKAEAVVGKLEEGTEEWLDYCAKKYSSFNREKGTYTGKSGTERKCLVTVE
jgi:BA14K-like protein